MFRYTIIDVGDDLVVLNKDDGALGTRRDSWPPRFPTEEEMKTERRRLKTERLEKVKRLEAELRERRAKSVTPTPQELDFDLREAEGSDDSGIVSCREEDQGGTCDGATSHVQTGEDATDDVVVEVTPDGEKDSKTEETPLVVEETEPKKATPPLKRKSTTTSVQRITPEMVIADDTKNPGDKPYIVAPTQKRQPKPKPKNTSCCVIL